MKRSPSAVSGKALKAFRRRKVMMLGEVAELVHSSIHTARRRLKEWRAHTSYNQNGRYYALPDVPEFDADGLWHWRGVFFSRYGNLKQTVVELIRRSSAGLDAGEMSSLLGLDPRSFLLHLPTIHKSSERRRKDDSSTTVPIGPFTPDNSSAVAR